MRIIIAKRRLESWRTDASKGRKQSNLLSNSSGRRVAHLRRARSRRKTRKNSFGAKTQPLSS
jgi:hypothetical protein